MKKFNLVLAATFIALSALAADDVKTLKISGNDTMQFDVKELAATAGQAFKVEFTNAGKLPVQVMGHNFVLLKPGTDPAAFGAAAMTSKETGYIPASKKDQIVAHTKLLGPGEVDTIDVKGLEAGVYPYICSFPGHFAIMKGTLTVK
jgi:azurin